MKLTLPQCITTEEGATCAGASFFSGNLYPDANSTGSVTGTIILNTAYLELINWEDLQPYPEVITNSMKYILCCLNHSQSIYSNYY